MFHHYRSGDSQAESFRRQRNLQTRDPKPQRRAGCNSVRVRLTPFTVNPTMRFVHR